MKDFRPQVHPDQDNERLGHRPTYTARSPGSLDAAAAKAMRRRGAIWKLIWCVVAATGAAPGDRAVRSWAGALSKLRREYIATPGPCH